MDREAADTWWLLLLGWNWLHFGRYLFPSLHKWKCDPERAEGCFTTSSQPSALAGACTGLGRSQQSLAKQGARSADPLEGAPVKGHWNCTGICLEATLTEASPFQFIPLHRYYMWLVFHTSEDTAACLKDVCVFVVQGTKEPGEGRAGCVASTRGFLIPVPAVNACSGAMGAPDH